MRPLTAVAVVLMMSACGTGEREAQVREAVTAFYRSFDEGFTKPADFAAEDWYHINPNGGLDKGREATLKTVRQVHQTFLKATTDTVKNIDVRFAADDVAVATVLSEMSPFTSPDGINHGAEGHLRTFVVVKRGGRWLVMQDHNTTIVPPPVLAAGKPNNEVKSKYALDSANWGRPYAGPEGYPKGARRAVLSTDPNTRGETYFAHFPAGTTFQPHWHSNGEYAVVLQGKVTHVVGTLLQPGDYVVIPAETNHAWELAPDSAAYLLIRRDGPMDVNFRKP